jgi:hypothetical protein
MVNKIDAKGAFDEFIKERSFSIQSMELSLHRNLTDDEKLDFTVNLQSVFNRTYS